MTIDIAGNINVLLVEDSNLQQIIISQIISHINEHIPALTINMIIASTFVEIMEKMTKDIDLVLLDLYLPDGYSLDAVPRIKQTNSLVYIAVCTGGAPEHLLRHSIEMSKHLPESSRKTLEAYDGLNEIAIARDVGCDDYIPKDSISVKVIHKIIVDVLRLREIRVTRIKKLQKMKSELSINKK